MQSWEVTCQGHTASILEFTSSSLCSSPSLGLAFALKHVNIYWGSYPDKVQCIALELYNVY